MIHRFDLWKNRVDRYLIDIVGLDSDSMEDWPWYDTYMSGWLPKDAAIEFALENGYINGLDD